MTLRKTSSSTTGEEFYTYAEPNKIIYIERETLAHLLQLTASREGFDLRDLVVTIFRDPILSTSAHSLHFLRAYHLIDLIRQTTQEDVEYVLLNSPEFSRSDKKKGVFTYHEPFVAEEEAPLEAGYPEGFEEPTGEAYTPEEAALEAVAEELRGAEPESRFAEAEREMAKAPPAPPEPGAAKKGKEFKKRKPKAEGDKGPRPKKSERRVIEEKIVEEESVQEALAAVKEKQDEGLEQRAREKKRNSSRPRRRKQRRKSPSSASSPTCSRRP